MDFFPYTYTIYKIYPPCDHNGLNFENKYNINDSSKKVVLRDVLAKSCSHTQVL